MKELQGLKVSSNVNAGSWCYRALIKTNQWATQCGFATLEAAVAATPKNRDVTYYEEGSDLSGTWGVGQ